MRQLRESRLRGLLDEKVAARPDQGVSEVGEAVEAITMRNTNAGFFRL